MWDGLKRWAEALKKEGLTLWFCCRHRDMPWLPKILAIESSPIGGDPVNFQVIWFPAFAGMTKLYLIKAS